MKLGLFITIGIVSIIYCGHSAAQSAAINDDGTIAHPSAILDVKVSGPNKKGVPIPRITATQRNPITSPAGGLLVYDSTLRNFYIHNGNAWARIGGSSSGSWLLTGNAGTIGYRSNVSMDGLTNATAIGAGAIVNASNKVRIGNTSVTVIEGQVPFTVPSDGRFKFNVRNDVKGLDFILKLNPVTYQFDIKKFERRITQSNVTHAVLNYAEQKAIKLRRTGFIAQEVEQAAKETGYNFSGIITPGSDREHYSLSYESFVVPLVKAVQEQQLMIDIQKEKMLLQQQKIELLEQELKLLSGKMEMILSQLEKNGK